MLKLLLSALVLAAVLVPGAQAQDTTHTVTVEIRDLPASSLSNGTHQTIPFNVTATIAGAVPCLASGSAGATYTVTLAAEVVDSTGNSTTAFVNPRQTTIAGPNVLPAAGGSAQRTIPATLVVNAGPYAGDALNATVQVVAAFVSSNGGCQGVGAAPASTDEATTRADFEPVRGFGNPEPPQAEMPGLGAALLLIALVAAVAFARRQ